MLKLRFTFTSIKQSKNEKGLYKLPRFFQFIWSIGGDGKLNDNQSKGQLNNKKNNRT